MSQEILERRYRRLLACYPPAYRAAYGEEMLAVAMAAAGPDRRWPDPGQAADLILTGLRRRLGSARLASLNPAWRDAAGIAAVIGPIVMAAFAVAPLPAPFRGTGGWQYFATASSWPRCGPWSLSRACCAGGASLWPAPVCCPPG